MNDNGEYDFTLKPFEIEFDLNTAFHRMERPSMKLLQSIVSGKIEMKNHDKALYTSNLFIEFEVQKENNGVPVPSGLSTTEADFWFFNAGPMGLFLETDFLKFCFERRKRYKLDTKKNDYESRNVGHGLIIPLNKLDRLLTLYNEFINS